MHEVTITGGGLKQAIKVCIDTTPAPRAEEPKGRLMEAMMKSLENSKKGPSDKLGRPITRSATEPVAG